RARSVEQQDARARHQDAGDGDDRSDQASPPWHAGAAPATGAGIAGAGVASAGTASTGAGRRQTAGSPRVTGAPSPGCTAGQPVRPAGQTRPPERAGPGPVGSPPAADQRSQST